MIATIKLPIWSKELKKKKKKLGSQRVAKMVDSEDVELTSSHGPPKLQLLTGPLMIRNTKRLGEKIFYN